jgi:hypothetical protein
MLREIVGVVASDRPPDTERCCGQFGIPDFLLRARELRPSGAVVHAWKTTARKKEEDAAGAASSMGW